MFEAVLSKKMIKRKDGKAQDIAFHLIYLSVLALKKNFKTASFILSKKIYTFRLPKKLNL